jgi:DNA-binding transcriptional regulator YiaG
MERFDEGGTLDLDVSMLASELRGMLVSDRVVGEEVQLMPTEDELFAAVEELLARGPLLPPPAERVRLREAAGLTQDDVAHALQARRETVIGWESGRTQPRPPRLQAYARLLEGWAERYPPPGGEPGPFAAAVHDASAVESSVLAATSTRTAATKPTSRRPGKPRAAKATSATPAGAADPRFPAGPLAVLDGAGTAYLTDGRTLTCAAATVAQLVEWALAAGLGQGRLHRSGRDADPLVVLTADVAERLGLPSRLTDRRGLRLPEDHPVVRDLVAAGWQLTRRGFGPWARIYQPIEGSSGRRCVQLAVVTWDALDARAWGEADQLAPAELARVLGTYATRVLTPRGSTAVNGLELMTALRPPTRAVRDGVGGWTSGPVPGSLTRPVDPAPPEAPDEHPVAHGRPEGQALDEEAYEWVRDPELLTDAECALPWAVGIDVNMAFAAAANRLSVGLSEPVHTDGPRFDKKIPASWYVDLSHIETDPRLPNPFTPTGDRPTGPAWYATPTVAYAVELGADVHPLQAWIRPESGPYLDPWYERLRDAYLATMADLGVTKDLTEEEFLDAMAGHKQTDPCMAAVLSAIKATVKGGVGKLRERPQGARYRPGERWPALERPTWRPDIRGAVIAAARTNMHRKMMKMAAAGHFPLAVLSDCVVYPSPGPSPLDLLPRTPEGNPVPGTFRLGVSPGMVKLEGTQPFVDMVGLADAGANPARHIKDGEQHDD